ncbi:MULTISPECIES: YaiI/YqxD family protein [unclassified Enterococcus]|uniref:YaiI/YqxD family protein n=1 Tax=unclassified Enterococcus TaxID=2608891 RepID=UPI0015560C6B|nr:MULTISPECIES: YaiI/YqxD family protein [unclassified Enterococcus]MBS7576677.1 YaiI/YqxD family protein [Enterococcus sp. MMGLQ5-2]MBS7583836.1 YaiI/YqxD family protein [Enterococcus sp. MMGLQ5-1]NPD11697.1 YaiI/YqxD family protein [Enterococcus sp. MMGLQ5-1]NPD36514.1 YaiI/YqxD family protein [Enterococcus sp. MMGLQ5-2]
MKILIDGDGSPVKKETIQIASQYQIAVLLITTHDHYSSQADSRYLTTIYIEKGADAVDFEIVKRAKALDIVITQDYGLASLLLAKNVQVIHQNGFQFTQSNIDQLLMQRYLGQKIRKAGGKTKGPKKYTAEAREAFQKLLHELIQKNII